METGINWDAVKVEICGQPWVYDKFERQYTRSLFLGTVFSLMPSGKYYTPWANSNVAPCPRCHGSGKVEPKVKVRTMKKWRAELERLRTLAVKRGLIGARWHEGPLGKPYYQHLRKLLENTCPKCEGLGSFEALQDQQYSEKLETEADAAGYYLFSGEGDPCDLFVGEGKDEDEMAPCFDEMTIEQCQKVLDDTLGIDLNTVELTVEDDDLTEAWRQAAFSLWDGNKPEEISDAFWLAAENQEPTGV